MVLLLSLLFGQISFFKISNKSSAFFSLKKGSSKYSFLEFKLRTLNLKLLQGKYLLGLDPYYYLRQATEILAEGKLPFPDMMRNAPFGIEKGFDLFPYFLAYFFHIFLGRPFVVLLHSLQLLILRSAMIIVTPCCSQ